MLGTPNRRALALLRDYLDRDQREQLAAYDGFALTGSDGRRYVLLLDCEGSVFDVGAGTQRGYGPLVYHKDACGGERLPLADSALAKKLALETDAPHFRASACVLGTRHGTGPWRAVNALAAWSPRRSSQVLRDLRHDLVAARAGRAYRGPGFERRWYGRAGAAAVASGRDLR